MSVLPVKLEAEREKQSADLWLAIELYLDGGNIVIAKDVKLLDGVSTLPALLDSGTFTDKGGNARAEFQALGIGASEKLKNRRAIAWELPGSAASTGDGRVLFDGVISKEPDNRDGALLLTLGSKIQRIITIPSSSDIIDTTTYPNADTGVAGKYKPAIYGSVEEAELLGIDVPISTSLAQDAKPGEEQLILDDATIFAASGSVVVDGTTYTYTARDDKGLYGAPITDYHYSGTAVYLSGSAVYIGANSQVAALDTVRGDDKILVSAVASLPAATATFASLPTVPQIAQRRNVRINFDEVDAANTAADAINAIQAAVVTDSNISTTTPLPLVFSTGISELSRNKTLIFPPPTQAKILTGTATVTFSMDATGYTGNATAKVGNTTVWAMKNGAVIYNNSPASIIYDEETNSLPLNITRTIAGNAVEMTVTAATRTIVLGNTDATAFADVDNGQQLVANQTTVNPNRGKITKAQLAVEWFPTNKYEATETTEVWFGGIKIGELSLDQLAGVSDSQELVIDVDSSGGATFQNSDFSVAAAGGTASLNNVQSFDQQSYSINYVLSSTAVLFLYRGRTSFRPPKGVASGSHAARVKSHSGSSALQATARINDSSTRAFQLVSGGTRTTGVFVTSDTVDCEFVHEIINGLFDPNDYLTEVKAYSLEVDWAINPITQNNVAASASRNVLNSSLETSVSGTGSGTVVVTVPASPRTIINTFVLPEITQWADLTGQQVKIVHISSNSVKVEVLQMQVAVDYDAEINVKPNKITANITGKSGNNSDVMQDIIETMGDKLETHELVKSRNWFTANGWQLSRRIGSPVDARTLLTKAADQSLAYIFDTDGRKAIVRRLDTSREQITLSTSDLTTPLQYGWAPRSITSMRLNYNFKGNGYTKVSVSDHTTEHWFNKGYCDNGRAEEAVEYNGIWLADDAAASNFTADYARLNGPARRLARIPVPFKNMDVDKGFIIDFTDLDARFMVTDIANADHWPQLAIEEIPE